MAASNWNWCRKGNGTSRHVERWQCRLERADVEAQRAVGSIDVQLVAASPAARLPVPLPVAKMSWSIVGQGGVDGERDGVRVAGHGCTAARVQFPVKARPSKSRISIRQAKALQASRLPSMLHISTGNTMQTSFKLSIVTAVVFAGAAVAQTDTSRSAGEATRDAANAVGRAASAAVTPGDQNMGRTPDNRSGGLMGTDGGVDAAGRAASAAVTPGDQNMGRNPDNRRGGLMGNTPNSGAAEPNSTRAARADRG